jgi:hypothetical protein
MSNKKPKYLEETTDNDLINIGPELLNYGRQAVLRKWDPKTPRVTEEEREIIIKAEEIPLF